MPRPISRRYTRVWAYGHLTTSTQNNKVSKNLISDTGAGNMPTYEYECEKCGHHFERFQSMTEQALKRCPKCRCKVKRLVGTGAGVLFKGSGFYQTDYRSRSYKEGVKKEKTDHDSKKGKKDKAASSPKKSTSNQSAPKETK